MVKAHERTVQAEQLREGTTVAVRGRTTFSRLAKQIYGEELQRSIARQTENGARYPIKVPHVTVTLANARVVLGDGQHNAGELTHEQLFVQESFYQSKSEKTFGQTFYTINHTGDILPTVFAVQPDGQYQQITLDNDLANDLDVTLLLSFYKPRNYDKRGVSLRSVFVNEPVKFYIPGVNREDLADYGIVVSGPMVANTPVSRPPVAAQPDYATTGAQQPAQTAPVGSRVVGGMPMPGVVTPTQTTQAVATPPAPVQDVTAGVVAATQLERTAIEQELVALQQKLAAIPNHSAFAPAQPDAQSRSPWETENPPVSNGVGIAYDGGDVLF